MKLVVTGGYGFIGSNFIVKLLESNEDYKITNIDAELNGSNPKNLDSIKNHENYKFVKGNITNRKLMEGVINDCDAVVNFAAESFVDRSINDANPFLVSNIRGTYTILDIITKFNKRMIQISTDEVFGSLTEGTANENSKFNPSSPYAATKAGVSSLTRTLAAEWGKEGIRVNAVCPGYIETDLMREAIDSGRVDEKELLNMIALERIGDPIEVSKVISFLLSDDSSYITGTTIDIDGGFSIRKIN